MIKLLKSLTIFILITTIISVKAANYNLKELIPVNIKTTIVTENFSYKDFYYNKDNNSIDFAGIKNLTDNDLPTSISIGLFGNNKKNLSVINYCSKEELLKSKEEKAMSIKIKSEDLPDDIKLEDIKYIAILGDNINCRTSGNGEFIGQTVKEIGMAKNTTLDKQTKFLFQILIVIGAFLITLFLYKFLFTTAYQNIDGDSVRKEYKKYNKQLKKEREEELKKNSLPVKDPKKTKTDEVLKQEEQAKREAKDETDLHNLYK